jgi:hypothetical protein
MRDFMRGVCMKAFAGSTVGALDRERLYAGAVRHSPTNFVRGRCSKDESNRVDLSRGSIMRIKSGKAVPGVQLFYAEYGTISARDCLQ